MERRRLYRDRLVPGEYSAGTLDVSHDCDSQRGTGSDGASNNSPLSEVLTSFPAVAERGANRSGHFERVELAAVV